jgi:mannose-1-phosphate guanylyltransferase
MKQEQDPTLLVLPADHIIADIDAFHAAIREAEALAQQDLLVTFGIVPTAAETGYGYVKRGESCGQGFKVSQFVEKPNLQKAQEYLAAGDFYWNSGMFLFRASVFLEELRRFRPDIEEACRAAVEKGRKDLGFFRLDEQSFSACPAESIDYAVMEKSDRSAVVPLDAGWNDVGSWSALWELDAKDENNNAVHGDVLTFDTTNSLVHAQNRLVTTVGLDGMIVIETKDAVLVADRSQSQEVKRIIEDLRAKERPEDQNHRVVYRPWGSFDSIEEGKRFKVKRITVKPGAKLSVQMHHHRAEHWIVVSGTARVTKGTDTILLTENESIYMGVGETHALENPGVIPLDIIEVQTGSYLGEDDIVRFEDIYGRSQN